MNRSLKVKTFKEPSAQCQDSIQLIQNKKEDQNRHESLRPSSVRLWKENHKTSIARESFVFDAAKL